MELYYQLAVAISTGAILALIKIIAIDIILSGDNAIVIAMATKNLPKHLQNKAIFWGTAGAIILRILFAIIVVALLKVPLVHFIGGLLLLGIAYNVLVEEEETNIKSHNSLFKSIATIIVADAAMSLDNVVAVAGAAHGHIGMIALGILVSIPIMIFGSKLIVKILERYRSISYFGSGILAWTAGELIVTDEKVLEFLKISTGPITIIITAILTAGVLLSGYAANQSKNGHA
ncbi:TerC family protein [Aquibacillus salsiterrae]|uniref:TerC family protein n=1 Tax=Aquibacillus salsiterrae TaxID=2950439 RepID=A0A9X4AFG7_9BACI|nr:TerC family protein [Aquibacillus salsiterrae]MDC3417997.1 TerC family protein [Aquibacillus salsiterrae]